MKKKILALTAGLLTALTLTACGKDPALTQFKEEIDSFCTKISDIDTEINNVDATSENATDELLGYLDQPVSYTHLDVYKRQPLYRCTNVRRGCP